MIISALLIAALYFWFPQLADSAGQVVMERNEPLVFGLITASMLLAVVAILKYQNRKLQFVLNRINILSNFVLLGVYVYRALTLSGESLLSQKGIGVLLPVISIVFLALANKAIQRDENLVKSVDRLR
jgi:uncharacterized membrane protein YidH (DUF202 family)